jgi:hypothetical protein
MDVRFIEKMIPDRLHQIAGFRQATCSMVDETFAAATVSAGTSAMSGR